jgi:tetratricopeptide (TPR) repeat protein
MSTPSLSDARRMRWFQFGQLYAVALAFTLVPHTLAWSVPRMFAGAAEEIAGDLGGPANEPASETTDPTRLYEAALTRAQDDLIHDRLDTALTWADEALRLDPDSEQARGTKSSILFERFWATKSEADVQEGRHLADGLNGSTAPAALIALGNLALIDGQAATAVQRLRVAVTAADNDAYAHHQLGFAFNEAKRPDEALPHLRRALELAPQMAWVQANLQSVLSRLGRCDEPIPGLLPETVAACSNAVALTMYENRRMEEAARLFERAVQSAPDTGVYYANLASALLQLGRRDQAIEYARRARMLGVTDHWVLGALGV